MAKSFPVMPTKIHPEMVMMMRGGANVEKDSLGGNIICSPLKPDILPLVETKTGEEDENVAFEAPANLFRCVEGEWRDRGEGTIRILSHKQTGQGRIIMRNSHTKTVCANHHLIPEMELTPMATKFAAFKWFARDYADGNELKLEHLCASFNRVSTAEEFKMQFDLVKRRYGATNRPTRLQALRRLQTTTNGFGDILPPGTVGTNAPNVEAAAASCISISDETANTTTTPNPAHEAIPLSAVHQFASATNLSPRSSQQQLTVRFGTMTVKNAKPVKQEQGFGTQFLPKPGSWNCSTCLLNNAGERATCAACGSVMPSNVARPTAESGPNLIELGEVSVAGDNEAAGHRN